MKPVRCAIYTRKSSDEGLEQGFNSLDAQREACAAYILSQASERWTALPVRYDDGGISGGTLERPALQRLLEDIAAGEIDIVVVYKVDRLSRSLFDFAKLVEMFERAGTSFVSITQSFNTTSSMGRLTLNMLLSFAQFEREVTAERIRDKIAASKAKGMWMGGIPPLGYAADGRSLKVIEEHADLVRSIYERYLELGSVRDLRDDLAEKRLWAPSRMLTSGKVIGSTALSRGQLYRILSNPTYVGEIVHHGITHKALFVPIIDRDLWERVQAQLIKNRQGESRTRNGSGALLGGKVVDEVGQSLLAVHTTKGSVRYNYYVSRALQHERGRKGVRIPARELEVAVVTAIAEALDDPLTLAARASLDLIASDVANFAHRAAELGSAIRKRSRKDIQLLVKEVRLQPQHLTIVCDCSALAERLDVTLGAAATTIEFVVPAQLSRSGHVMRLIHGNGAGTEPRRDTSILRLLTQAYRFWGELKGGSISPTQLAAREGISRSYVARVTRLAFLSPEIVAALLRGDQRATLSRKELIAVDAIPIRWKMQAERFLAMKHDARCEARRSQPALRNE